MNCLENIKIKKLIISLTKVALISYVAYFLSACVPVAFVAGASAGGAVVYDKRGVNTMVQDRDMANATLRKINADPILRKQTHISIIVFNHVMLMVGQAPNEELRNRVYQYASSTPHLKRIYNQVTIEPPFAASAQAHDSWLTTKVKTAMLAEKGLHSSQIKVVTEDSVVYLLGIVTPRQAELAADVASNVSGVRKVVKIFEFDL